MDEVLTVIREFVSGEIGSLEFRDRLYADERFETFLRNDPNLRQPNYVGRSVYLFLLEQDYDDPGGVLSAQGALADFMQRNGIDHRKTRTYAALCNLVVDAQPRWLLVDSKYVFEKIISAAEGRTGGELRSWLAEEFLRRFRYAEKPPEWIQSPAWPINQNGPLVFLGDLEIKNYFHDLAKAYLFHDPKSGTTETIIQVY